LTLEVVDLVGDITLANFVSFLMDSSRSGDSPAPPQGIAEPVVVEARRALQGIDEQVARAAKAVARLAPVKRNRFIALDGAAKSVNRELEAGPGPWPRSRAHQPRGLPRRNACDSEFVIGSYHRLSEIRIVPDVQA